MGKSIFFRLAVAFIEALPLQTFKKMAQVTEKKMNSRTWVMMSHESWGMSDDESWVMMSHEWWWVMSHESWVMSHEWWVMSDGGDDDDDDDDKQQAVLLGQRWSRHKDWSLPILVCSSRSSQTVSTDRFASGPYVTAPYSLCTIPHGMESWWENALLRDGMGYPVPKQTRIHAMYRNPQKDRKGFSECLDDVFVSSFSYFWVVLCYYRYPSIRTLRGPSCWPPRHFERLFFAGRKSLCRQLVSWELVRFPAAAGYSNTTKKQELMWYNYFLRADPTIAQILTFYLTYIPTFYLTWHAYYTHNMYVYVYMYNYYICKYIYTCIHVYHTSYRPLCEAFLVFLESSQDHLLQVLVKFWPKHGPRINFISTYL